MKSNFTFNFQKAMLSLFKLRFIYFQPLYWFDQGFPAQLLRKTCEFLNKISIYWFDLKILVQPIRKTREFLNKISIILPSVFCFFFLGPGISLAKGNVEGSFRLRTTWPQIKAPPPLLTQGRLKIKGEFQPSNETKTQVYLLASNFYGEDQSFEKSLQIYPSVRWLINKDLELKLGRNLYESHFHQIVSLNNYEPFFYVFDGVFLEYSTQKFNVNFWGAYPPKQWQGLEQVRNFRYGFGFFLDVKSASSYIDYFNAHAAYLANSFIEGSANKISRYGLGLEGTVKPIDLSYAFTAVGHGQGVQFKLEESMFHFLLSYSYPEFFNSKIFAGYHTDSPKYDPWLYDRHKNAGFLDLFSWGNLTYYFMGLSSSLFAGWDLEILFYDLSLTEKGLAKPGAFGSLFVKEDNKKSGQNLGRELDFRLKTQWGKKFEVSFLTGIFIPRLKSASWFAKESFYNKAQLTGFYKF